MFTRSRPAPMPPKDLFLTICPYAFSASVSMPAFSYWYARLKHTEYVSSTDWWSPSPEDSRWRESARSRLPASLARSIAAA